MWYPIFRKLFRWIPAVALLCLIGFLLLKFIPGDPAINLAVDAELGVRYLLNNWASLSLLTEWDYVNGDRENSINHTRYRLGLGVGW